MALSNGPNLGVLVDGGIGETHYNSLMAQWRAFDGLIQARVVSHTLTTPPTTPIDGVCYIVPTGSTGVWSTHTNKIARYSSKQSAWEFYTPKTGWFVYSESISRHLAFKNGSWSAHDVDKADLINGKVPSNQLPSFVDDVVEFDTIEDLPEIGESGKIYVTLDNDNSWRWTGSTYQKVSQPLDEMPQSVAEAGTSETLYAATARRIRQAITAWWNTVTAIENKTIGLVSAAAGVFTTLRATGQIRSDSSFVAAAGTPVYLGNTEDASVAELSSPSPAVLKIKTAYQDTFTVSALTGNTSHTVLNIDTAPAANFLMFRQSGVLGAILGSEASIFGTNPDNYGVYLYNGGEYFVAVGAAKRLRVLSDGVDVIGKLTTSNVKEDGAGNLAVGAGAPKPWAVGKAIDVGLAGAFFGDGINASWSAGIAQNAYASAYPGTWAYKVTGIGASRYQCNENLHQWSSAPAGVADEPVPFNLDMTLQNGNLGLGVVPAPHAPSGFGGPMLQVGGRAALLGSSVYCTLANNAYYNAGYYRYIANGAASSFEQSSGASKWFSAPAGNAGDPISFTQAMTLDAAGNLGLGVTPSAWLSAFKAIELNAGALSGISSSEIELSQNAFYSATTSSWTYKHSAPASQFLQNAGSSVWLTAPSGNAGDQISFIQAMTLDAAGKLLVGVTTSSGYGNGHRLSRTVGEGIFLLSIDGNSGALTSVYQSVLGGGFSTADAAEWVGRNSVTNRSINAGGTINASGADYAEYERNNGLVIGKGSVVGFKADGTLTLTYAEAIRFGIKSTNPSYVGGDVWGSEDQVGKRPDQPSYTAPTYTGPQSPVEPIKPAIQEGEEVNAEADDAAYLEALNAYQEQLTAYFDAQAAHKAAVEAAEAAHAEAVAQYEADKAAFDARLEAARQTVDRVAYSGKVPVNVLGATPGGYIVAAEGEAGEIVGKFVADPDFAQYKKAVGRVNRILEDGRCEVAVIVH